MDPLTSAVVEPVTNSVLELVKKNVDYIRYRRNVVELDECVTKLVHEKQKVRHQCEEASNNVLNIEGKAAEWLQKVDKFEKEVNEYKSDDGHSKTKLSNCLFPCFRHRLGRLAKKKSTEGQKLINDCPKSDEIAYRKNVTSNDATLSIPDLMDFGSRKSIMEEIMKQLEDPTVRMIGVHGPGGVGKSTLIKAVAENARDKKLFNVVAISEITANPNLKKIQEDIAYVLGLRLEGEGENVRADSLRRRLKQEKENILIILDDLWDGLDLNKLGIPLDDDMDAPMKAARIPDQKNLAMQDDKGNDDDRELLKKEKSVGDYNGCKILLTSRNKIVLSERMSVKLKSNFLVKELDELEALRLLQKVARIPDQMSHSKQEIVKYCAGIPMAIVTVGMALRDKSESVWEATLDKLKSQELVGAQNSMEISVKMSYDHLENEELKSVFLLCAQLGHQPLIMDLVKYSFGLGVLEGVYSLMEARDKIYKSIQKLKDSSLVTLDESSGIHFKMHDMVRDAALSIAHKEKNIFTLRHAKLDDWPELERCTSISICNTDIIDELPDVINCPKLKFFQINSDDPSLKIPECFFNEMKKLRVLILIGIHLESLSPLIKCLPNLRLLCLEQCILEGDLSFIGKLKKLRILSFSGSRLQNLPAELGFLSKLQLLDISNCSMVDMSSTKLISRLTSLEELYIGKSLIKRLTEGETYQSRFSFLPELKHLHQLKVVDLCIPCAAILPKDLFFDKLNDFKIVIGDFKTLLVGDFRMPNKHEALRSLALQLKDEADNIHSHKGMKLLFKRVENLLLGDLSGVQNVIDELNLDGFPDLKHLSVTNNDGIKYINSMDLSHSRDIFPNLESLCLYELTNIEMICRSPVTIASFAKLKIIKVIGCSHLKNLFSFYKDKFVASLETIDVSECDALKEIIETRVNPNKVEFLKLHCLTLQSLSSFTSFYNIVEGSCVSQLTKAQIGEKDDKEITIAQAERSDIAPPLFDELVEIPNIESLNLSSVRICKIWCDQPLSSFCFKNLIKLVVKDCAKLKYLCSLSVANALTKLKGLFISECPLMEKIFKTEGNSAVKVNVFPKLEEIHLSEMNMLTDIWHAESSADSFSSLISVAINGCNKLDKIFPSHIEGWFASLNNLEVSRCKSVEVIFEINDSQRVDACGGRDTNLQLIYVWSLEKLKQVWSRDPGGILNFKKLCSVKVLSCDKLRNVFPASMARDIQKLESVSVLHCEKMVEIVACEEVSETNNETLVFPDLQYVELYALPNMKQFYTGRHTIECTKLKHLEVSYCDKLKIFPTEINESTNEESPVFSAEVIPNLEILEINFEEAHEWLLINTKNYQMHRLKELTLTGSFKSVDLLYQFLYKLPNLEKLTLSFCYQLEELVPSENTAAHERLGTVLKLKELNMLHLKIKHIGFEREPVLQRIELLSLYSCNELRNLAPPSVSLAYLTKLEVQYCHGLRNLMASSTAKSLVQLKSMKIERCGKVEEIVSNEGNEEDKVMIEIVFSILISIELVELKNLKSFCSYKNCEFRFPSLEILIVRDCPMMKTFTQSLPTAPKLQNILTYKGEVEAKWQWEGDLNATIQKGSNDELLESARTVSELSLRNSRLQEIWLGSLPIPNLCFSNLNSLTVDDCQFLSDAVLPFNLLPLLTKLETLKVQKCSSVKTIFDVRCITRDIIMTFPLKSLTLCKLPKLESVWNEDPEGTLCMQLLQKVSVENCKCLTSVFPTSVRKDLGKLENLVLKNCGGLMAIVAGDNTDTKGTNLEHTTTFELTPNLQHLTLGENELKMILDGEFQGKHLHKLKEITLWFHIESDVFPYGFLQQLVPNIEKLELCSGSFTEIFCLQSPIVDDTSFLSQLKVLRLNSFPELISIGLENSLTEPFPGNLEILEVNSCDSLQNLVPCTMSFSKMTLLNVKCCNSLLYLFTSSTAKSLTQLKEMKISSCDSIEEIVYKEGSDSHEDEIIFPQLNILKLGYLRKLRSFYKGSLSFPSLEELKIMNCYWMETLCPGTLKTDKLVEVKFDYRDAIPLEIDLMSTMRKNFQEMISEYASNQSRLKLRDSPLQEIWLGSMSIPDSCFSNLKSLIVEGCHFLSEAVLPHNLLPLLSQLETLEVRNCDFVKTIFDVKDIEMTTTETIHLPLPFDLKKLILEKLPNLENICNEDPKGTNLELTFGHVKSLALYDLPKLKYDMFKTFRHLQVDTENPVCIGKRTPNIEQLTLSENELKMILNGEFQGNHLHKLKVLALFFDVDSNVFLQGVSNIEKLVVCDDSFKKIFSFNSLNVEKDELLSQKVLCLDSLPEIVSIGLESSCIVPFLRNLETLAVISCFSSKYLVPCSVSFSNLTFLEVKDCKRLQYLFSSSTAKSLTQLKTMKIKRCLSIEVGVSKEVDESDEDEIVFGQLKCLKLKHLRKLRSFYKGSLSFPSLEELSIINCDRMLTLCEGTVKTDNLSRVTFDFARPIPLETDLNSAMQIR